MGGCIKKDSDLYMQILMEKKFEMTERVLHRKLKQVLRRNEILQQVVGVLFLIKQLRAAGQLGALGL